VDQRKFRSVCYLVLSVIIITSLLISSVRATPPTPVSVTATPEETPSTQPTSAGKAEPVGFFAGLSRSSYMLGDMGGLRPLLSKGGLSLTISETSEGLGNISGGAREGFEYDGLTQMDLQLDTQRAFNLHGGTFNISGLQIHGRNLSADNLNTLQTASGIESDRATRLWELWYQQKFLEEDRLDVTIGKQSLDQEFMNSQGAALFVNTMFGWPMVPSADLPGGGPAYPLSALGVRARFRPTDSLTFLVGVFNGSPVSHNIGDPQEQNPSGTSFPLNGGALVIAEVQYAYPSLGTMVYDEQSQPLSGTYRLGAWFDSESFADLRFDNTGAPLASPTSTGIAATHHGNFGIYGVMDQMIWHSEEDADHALSVFIRAMGTPQDDRNLIDFSLNAGFTLHDPIPHRDDDTRGLGMGFAKVSDTASDADRDVRNFSGAFFPVRGSETFIELTYQYQFTPWCQLQPDFQYVFNPGGGVLNPSAPGERIKDEAVFGIRVNILF
jgi:porin